MNNMKNWYSMKLKLGPIYVKTAISRKKYLEEIEGVEITAGYRHFLLNPNRVISRYRVAGHKGLAQRSRDRINDIDRKILTHNFCECGYSNDQVKTIVEYIISSTGLELRSLDPRDYTIDKDLNVSFHSIKEQLKLIKADESKKTGQEMNL